LGLVIPQEGEVLVEGESVLGKTDYKRKIGYMPQNPPFPENLTPRELLELIAQVRDQEPSAEDILQGFRLTPFLDEKIKNLSGGTRQKVNALVAFAFGAKLFILDEPTVGLDPLSSAYLKRLVLKKREEGKSFLLTSSRRWSRWRTGWSS